MDYVFIEPISMTSMFIVFIAFLVLLVYLTFLFTKRSRILSLRKIPTAFIIGFPNSGKSFIIKELCKCETWNFDKMLNISYSDFMHDGTSKLKLLDHHGFFSKDGKVEDGIVDNLKKINPKYIIGIVDVSPFSGPIENQINFLSEINKEFRDKKIFLVANKVDGNSKSKLKIVEQNLGKNFYQVRINKPADVKKLRDDLIGFLKKD